MLPLDAALSTEPGATSTVKVGDPESVFEMPQSERLLRDDGNRIGGVGVKIQPDFSYANLYHWLLGDTHFYKGFVGVPMPIIGRPYFESPDGASGRRSVLSCGVVSSLVAVEVLVPVAPTLRFPLV
jgi:hypothetical protein